MKRRKLFVVFSFFSILELLYIKVPTNKRSIIRSTSAVSILLLKNILLCCHINLKPQSTSVSWWSKDRHCSSLPLVLFVVRFPLRGQLVGCIVYIVRSNHGRYRQWWEASDSVLGDERGRPEVHIRNRCECHENSGQRCVFMYVNNVYFMITLVVTSSFWSRHVQTNHFLHSSLSIHSMLHSFTSPHFSSFSLPYSCTFALLSLDSYLISLLIPSRPVPSHQVIRWYIKRT